MQILEPVDAEQAIIDALTPYGFQIATSLPASLPERFQRVVAAGGANRNLVTDTPTLVVEAFHKLESRANQDANRMLAILQALIRTGYLGDAVAYRLQVAAIPQNFPLPSVPSHYRYIFTIAPDLRRRELTI